MEKGYPNNKPDTLSTRERKVLEYFEECLEMAMDNDGCNFEKIESFKEKAPDIDVMNKIFGDYQKSLFKAIRVNLHNHPLVPTEVKAVILEWMHTQRVLGHKNLLRKAKRGLEVGVKRPLTIEEVKLKNAIEELLFRKEKVGTPPEMENNEASTIGEIFQQIRLTRIYDPDNPPPRSKKLRSWTEVHLILVKKGIVKTTRQVFLRKSKRLSPTLFRKPKPKSKNPSEEH